MKNLKSIDNFTNESVKLDKDEMALFRKIKNVPDATLLSWCGYSSKRDYEDSSDEKYSKELLVISHYDDIEANI